MTWFLGHVSSLYEFIYVKPRRESGPTCTHAFTDNNHTSVQDVSMYMHLSTHRSLTAQTKSVVLNTAARPDAVQRAKTVTKPRLFLSVLSDCVDKMTGLSHSGNLGIKTRLSANSFKVCRFRLLNSTYFVRGVFGTDVTSQEPAHDVKI